MSVGALDSSVTLDEVFAVVGSKRVPLAPELAGYLVLEIAEHADPGRGRRRPEERLRRRGGHGRPGEAEARRPRPGTPRPRSASALARLLEASGSQTPALAAASKRKSGAGLPALAEELEAALIPVNRAAGRRALARLAREVKRVTLGVGRNAMPSTSDAARPPAPAVGRSRSPAARATDRARSRACPRADPWPATCAGREPAASPARKSPRPREARSPRRCCARPRPSRSTRARCRRCSSSQPGAPRLPPRPTSTISSRTFGVSGSERAAARARPQGDGRPRADSASSTGDRRDASRRARSRSAGAIRTSSRSCRLERRRGATEARSASLPAELRARPPRSAHRDPRLHSGHGRRAPAADPAILGEEDASIDAEPVAREAEARLGGHPRAGASSPSVRARTLSGSSGPGPMIDPRSGGAGVDSGRTDGPAASAACNATLVVADVPAARRGAPPVGSGPDRRAGHAGGHAARVRRDRRGVRAEARGVPAGATWDNGRRRQAALRGRACSSTSRRAHARRERPLASGRAGQRGRRPGRRRGPSTSWPRPAGPRSGCSWAWGPRPASSSSAAARTSTSSSRGPTTFRKRLHVSGERFRRRRRPTQGRRLAAKPKVPLTRGCRGFSART